jgi:hypothetical protein
MTDQNLTLQESLLLLSLNDRTGKPDSAYLAYAAIHAAAMAELWRLGRIRVEAGEVIVEDVALVGDELLDVALSRLAACERNGQLKPCIGALYRDQKMPFEVLALRLVRRGILTLAEARTLLVFKQTVYPTRDPGPEEALRRRIYEALHVAGAVDEPMAILVALLQASRAMPLVVPDKAELKTLLPRIETICASSAIAATVGQALAAGIADWEAQCRAQSNEMMMNVAIWSSSSD